MNLTKEIRQIAVDYFQEVTVDKEAATIIQNAVTPILDKISKKASEYKSNDIDGYDVEQAAIKTLSTEFKNAINKGVEQVDLYINYIDQGHDPNNISLNELYDVTKSVLPALKLFTVFIMKHAKNVNKKANITSALCLSGIGEILIREVIKDAGELAEIDENLDEEEENLVIGEYYVAESSIYKKLIFLNNGLMKLNSSRKVN